jgi:monovalent cation:H+ antiporter, CPA1 family
MPVILVLAFVGVAIAAAIVAAGLHFLVGWSWIGASLFGVLIAATDPVSVIATFKETKVAPRLGLLVEAESLFNDGAAAVGVAVLLVVARSNNVEVVSLSALLLWKAIGGFVMGGGVAGGLLLLAGRADDHLVEITLTTVAAYGAFLIAERAGTSGVLASLTAGMVVGNIGWRGYISQSGRGHVLAFWEYAAFLANSIVFILIGLHEAAQAPRLLTQTALIAIALTLLGRAAAIYPLSVLFARSSLALSFKYQHMLVWGGLRGALGLVLALTLPDGLLERNAIVSAAFAVVAFSIFVQGSSIPLLIRRLGK